MKTDELARLLATGVERVDRRAPLRRAGIAVALGVLLAGALMAGWLGVRTTLGEDAGAPMLWVKFAFVAWLAAAGAIAALGLARPGVRLARAPVALAAPVLGMWVLAGIVLAGADAPERATLLLGQTWSTCPFNIAVLSLPVLAAALWGMRGFAPTHLAWAGGASGLFAGAVGAFVYAFHCPELAAPFLGLWYVLGMLVPAALGALVGPRVLRW
ncbi:MAG: DUF1109 domain-containing protein [Pseudomonadota bacterium]